MRLQPRALLVFLVLFCASASAPAQTPSAPAITMVETEPGVRVEAVDWGGSGPPVMLLSGLGGTARGMQSFAGALRESFHVYGMTRRGYAPSSAPLPAGENYSGDRLGDDVLAVLDHLHLAKPLLIGFSFGGEELSSIGSRHPDRIAGLVYLDAGNRYALSKAGSDDLQIDIITMRRYLLGVLDQIDAADEKRNVDAFLDELPEFQKELLGFSKSLATASPMKPDDLAKETAQRQTPEGRAERAIFDSEQRYASITCPVLAFFPYPHDLPATVTGDARAQREKEDMTFIDQRSALFRALPDAKVILVPHASHAVQDSNRGEVLAAIREFATRVNPK